MEKIIETSRLWLRMPEEIDAFQVNEAVNETFEDLKPFMGWAQERPSLEVTHEQIIQARMRWETKQEYRIYMIEKETGKFVGSTGFIRFDERVPSYEIGYWCRKSMQSKGYVWEAVKALTIYAFDVLKANRVEIKCDRDNDKSRLLADRLGFKLEGCHINDAVKADGSGLRSTMVFARLNKNGL